MSREKETYRLTLENLNDKFPEKEMLYSSEVARYTGFSETFVKENFPIKKIGGRYCISKTNLAQFLSN